MTISLPYVFAGYTEPMSAVLREMMHNISLLRAGSAADQLSQDGFYTCSYHLAVSMKLTETGIEATAKVAEDQLSPEFIEKNRGLIDSVNADIEKALPSCLTNIVYDVMDLTNVQERIGEYACSELEYQINEAMGGTT